MTWYPHAFFHGDEAYSIILGRSLFNHFQGTKPIQLFPGDTDNQLYLKLGQPADQLPIQFSPGDAAYLFYLTLSQPADWLPIRFFPGDITYLLYLTPS